MDAVGKSPPRGPPIREESTHERRHHPRLHRSSPVRPDQRRPSADGAHDRRRVGCRPPAAREVPRRREGHPRQSARAGREVAAAREREVPLRRERRCGHPHQLHERRLVVVRRQRGRDAAARPEAADDELRLARGEHRRRRISARRAPRVRSRAGMHSRASEPRGRHPVEQGQGLSVVLRQHGLEQGSRRPQRARDIRPGPPHRQRGRSAVDHDVSRRRQPDHERILGRLEPRLLRERQDLHQEALPF